MGFSMEHNRNHHQAQIRARLSLMHQPSAVMAAKQTTSLLPRLGW